MTGAQHVVHPSCKHCGGATHVGGVCPQCSMTGRTLRPLQTTHDIQKDMVRESMLPLVREHRLEHVALKDGVFYINDSKATNVNSTWYALECMERPVVWIAGGVDKGNDYGELLEAVRGRVKALYTLGTDNMKLIHFMRPAIPVVIPCTSMREAVVSASVYAEPGDVVLLSPACASFDLFENYEDRGQEFKREVARL